MDSTKENILMCEKANEVQGLWEPIVGDVYWSEKYGIAVLNEPYNNATFPENFIDDGIWLPRQDQLQGMVEKRFVNEYGLKGFISFFGDFAKEFEYMDNGNDKRFTSMEQLWLAFVMKEKYSKIWDGKEWILQNQ